MILLTTTASLLEIITGASVSSINVQASWIDLLGTTLTPNYTNTLITTATTTTIIGSPATSTERAVKNLCVYNSSASSCQVTIVHTDGTTAVKLFNYTMLTGEAVYWSEGRGFYVQDANGNLKTTGGVTSVSFTGGLISVATPTSTPALTVAGTSGGIVYFSSASTWATSALLASTSVVLGGGAGAAPNTSTQLTFSGATLTVGLSGTSSGILSLAGSTSGTATFTAPAVAGTITNAILISNSIQQAAGTVIGINGDTGISRSSAGVLDFGNGTQGDYSGTLVATSLNLAGKVIAYNGLSTVANGIAPIVYTYNSTGNTANIGTTNLSPANLPYSGIYRISIYIDVQTPGTTSTMPQVNLGWTSWDEGFSQVLTAATPTNTGNNGGIYQQATVVIGAVATLPIYFSTSGYASTGAAMTYALHIRVEYLGV